MTRNIDPAPPARPDRLRSDLAAEIIADGVLERDAERLHDTEQTRRQPIRKRPHRRDGVDAVSDFERDHGVKFRRYWSINVWTSAGMSFWVKATISPARFFETWPIRSRSL